MKTWKASGKRRRGQTPGWTILLLYVLAAFILATSIPRLERWLLPESSLGLTPEAALAIYSAIGTGMLALTGIVFSLAFVMVQFSSSAYSPRLVQWLAKDPVIQHATGVFTMTFLYALGAAGWLGREGSREVPVISAVFVYLLLIVSVFFFAALLQRLTLLQISKVLSFLGDEGRKVIAENYAPLAPGEEDNGGRADVPEDAPASQTIVYQGPPRVIASLNIAGLVDLARAADAVVVVESSVGASLVDGARLARVFGGREPIPEELIRRAIYLEEERTFEQDPKYALRLLVDVAIKALSPAINDPTTAVQALTQLEDLLRRLGRSRLDVGHGRDREGHLRLAFPTPEWGDFLLLAFDEIRYFGATSIQVMRKMRKALTSIATEVPPGRRAEVEHFLSRLDSTVGRSFADPEERTAALQEDSQGLGLPQR